MIDRRVLLPLVLISLALLPGCLLGSDKYSDHSGRYLSAQTLAEVEPGASKEFVLSVCGEPTSRIEKDDGTELWRWSYSSTTKSSGSVFLVAARERTETTSGTAWIKFQDDRVVRVWRDEQGE